eukprot:1224303-Alexandrium_andersonii.AAC.1
MATGLSWGEVMSPTLATRCTSRCSPAQSSTAVRSGRCPRSGTTWRTRSRRRATDFPSGSSLIAC